jgi:hypothetical protein
VCHRIKKVSSNYRAVTEVQQKQQGCGKKQGFRNDPDFCREVRVPSIASENPTNSEESE